MIAAQYITLSELQRRVRQVLEERFALPISGRPETVGIQNGDVGALPLSPDDPNFTAVGCRHC